MTESTDPPGDKPVWMDIPSDYTGVGGNAKWRYRKDMGWKDWSRRAAV